MSSRCRKVESELDVRGRGATAPVKSNESFLETSASSHSHTAQYSKLSEKIRSFSSSNHLAHSFQCAAFCGGTSCKHESPVKWGVNEGVAFNGLSSHWVTDKLLAMARPSTKLFEEYNIIQQFIGSGINAVFNLQTPGEHAQCGPGLESSGFTYNPEELMRSNIYFHNYPWPDYGSPAVSITLDVVKVIDFCCSTGKVAIHCHAGLGRTGVVLACYLMYSQRLSPDEAIAIIREKRHGSIQTRGQLEVVEDFYCYLCYLWKIYPQALCLTSYLQKQSKLLHGDEEKKYRYIPKVVSLLCERMRKLSNDRAFNCSCTTPEANTGKHKNKESEALLLDGETPVTGCHDPETDVLQSILLSSRCCHCGHVTEAVHNIEEQFNSQSEWPLLQEESNPAVLFPLLYHFFDNQSFLFGNAIQTTECVFWESLNKQQKATLSTLLDTIKTIIIDYKLTDSTELIVQHLLLILRTTNGYGRGSSDNNNLEQWLNDYF